MFGLISRSFRIPVFVALCLALPAACPAQELPAALSEGYPVGVFDTGDAIWAVPDHKLGQRRRSEYFYKRWNPVSGELKDLPVPTDFSAGSALSTGAGVVFLGETVVYPVSDHPPRVVLLLTHQGKAISVTPPLERSRPHILALADQSVLLVGGTLPDGKQRTAAVERVALVNGKLEVERLPDLPGPTRGAYALVALADGRAMALGGTASSYIGCSGCLADTFILDVKTKTWTSGPKMGEPRANASATLLPDGSVLVAGGWSPGNDWSEGASRTTERWDPQDNRFKADAPLPFGVAMHRAIWAAGRQGKHLLLAGGMVKAWEGNNAVLAFDVAGDEWRLAGEGCKANDRSGALEAGPFIQGKEPYMWCMDGHFQRRYVALRLPSEGVRQKVDEERGHAFLRRFAFLPSRGATPALAIGGGAEGVYASGAADAIWPDGRMEALSPLNHPRTDAKVFGLPDGSYLVVGGEGGRLFDRSHPALPAEWLSAKPDLGRARWVDVDLKVGSGEALGQLTDGSLIAVSGSGSVRQIRVSTPDGKPKVQSTVLPPLNRMRSSSYNSGEASRVLVRGLSDGRIIVAGGEVQRDNIAVLQADSMQSDAVDRYVGIGELRPSRRHEIYQPDTKSWRNAAPSSGEGGQVAILDDGRVVKLKPGKIVGEQKEDGSWPMEPGLLEISSADGGSWRDFGAQAAPQVELSSHAHPFVLQGELFLSGEGANRRTGGGPGIVQWFNVAAGRWETLWQSTSKDNWRDHLGRVIIRKLANGKRVVLPVEGL